MSMTRCMLLFKKKAWVRKPIREFFHRSCVKMHEEEENSYSGREKGFTARKLLTGSSSL